MFQLIKIIYVWPNITKTPNWICQKPKIELFHLKLDNVYIVIKDKIEKEIKFMCCLYF